jgi:hypothetical protein
LTKYDFEDFGEYAFIPVPTKRDFDAIMDYLDDKFAVPDRQWKFLDSLEDSFTSGRGKKFDVAQAPKATFPMFYRLAHRMTKVSNPKRPELKIYPVVYNASLMFVVDLSTNPVFRKYINKSIKGTTKKFDTGDALYIRFFDTKNDLVRAVREMRQDGVKVTNIDELKEEVKDLDLKAYR